MGVVSRALGKNATRPGTALARVASLPEHPEDEDQPQMCKSKPQCLTDPSLDQVISQLRAENEVRMFLVFHTNKRTRAQ